MKQTKYEQLHQKYVDAVGTLDDSDEIKEIKKDIAVGNTHVLKMKRLESSSFDLKWIKEIEDCIFDIGKIVNAPKITTKIVGDVVKIELARKIGAESVQHLSSHTNYIKEVDENGNVIPSKILNLGSDDQWVTYENKFIATVIRKLVLFIEKRYEYAQTFVRMANADVLYVKHKSMIDGMEVEIESKVKITQPLESSMDQAKEYLARIEEVRRYILFYYDSEFMKHLKNERNIRAPIMMTNILKKNPYYNHCYKLFLFIESYQGIGIQHRVVENYQDLTEKDVDEINKTILGNFLSVGSEEPTQKHVREVEKESKPKILTSMDDEIFEFGPLQKGPIHYIRADQEYLANMVARHRVPLHLDSTEKVYYEDEILDNFELDADLEELKKLIRRKKEELKLWEERVQTTVAKRQWEEEVARRKEELRVLKEKEALIRKARERLVEAASKNDDILAEKEQRKIEREAAEAFKQAKKEAKAAAEEEAKHHRPRSAAAKKAARERAIARLKEQKAAEKATRLDRIKEKKLAEKEKIKQRNAVKKEKQLAKEKELHEIAKQKKREKRIAQQAKEKVLAKERKAAHRAKMKAKRELLKKENKQKQKKIKEYTSEAPKKSE